MSSLSKRYRSARPAPGEFMPPNPRTLGAVPFGDPQRIRLGAWLREAAWPRDHMDLVELEGYLVALIAWPVSISSGAWLPHVWGSRGWKVPTNITSQALYDEFIALIFGFMQELDRELSNPASRFEGSALRNLQGRERIEAFHRWGRGFMTALSLGAQGYPGHSAIAGAAVQAIARTTSSSAPPGSRALETIVTAVRSLMEQRSARGPLGPLGPLKEAVSPASPVLSAKSPEARPARTRI